MPTRLPALRTLEIRTLRHQWPAGCYLSITLALQRVNMPLHPFLKFVSATTIFRRCRRGRNPVDSACDVLLSFQGCHVSQAARAEAFVFLRFHQSVLQTVGQPDSTHMTDIAYQKMTGSGLAPSIPQCPSFYHIHTVRQESLS